MRTIQSPGVEIFEFDLSSRLATFAGTDVFVTGFASKGPTDEIIRPSSLREFEAIYGVPQTPAERYFYYSVEPLITAGANVYVSRLPYGQNLGEGFGDKYGALVYPVKVVTTSYGVLSAVGNDMSATSATYVIGKPKYFNLTKSQYLSCLDGTGFTWSSMASASDQMQAVKDFGGAAIVILNKGMTTVNERFEGYYVGITDNTNINPATDHDTIRDVYSTTAAAPATGTSSYLKVPENRINFALSGTSISQGSVSQYAESIAGFDIENQSYKDTLNISIFKLRQSIFNPDTIKLDFYLEDAAAGSLDYYRQTGDTTGGGPIPFYIETRLNNSSRNATVIVNPYISNRNTATWLDPDGVPTKAVRMYTTNLIEDVGMSSPGNNTTYNLASGALADLSASLDPVDALFPLGAYSDATFANKSIGSLPLKIDRVLDLLRNDEIYNIDVSVEAGLGTIYATACANNTQYYDDLEISSGLIDGLNKLASTTQYVQTTILNDLRGNYNTIYSRFQRFAELERKDHLFIADPIRHIFVTGENSKTINNPNKNWSQHIFSALRHQFEFANSSYATTYANWARVNDKFSGTDVWVPFSGIAASIMTTTDTTTFPWYAPAGLTRGRVFGVNDIAVYPNQKQRDDLYKFAMNPITLFREGIVVYGQKTLQKMPSAFDRINVRRLFLYLEKVTKATARYYVFEPNTLFTRTRILDDLRPLFERAKNNDGVYDYILVCDDRNNTPDVIDQNELVIDIYLKPVRAAEFILVNFYATRTSTNFDELVG